MAALKLFEVQKMFNVGLSRAQYDEMVEYCKPRKMTMADLIREATEAYISANKEESHE